jgi:hypothetical protein
VVLAQTQFGQKGDLSVGTKEKIIVYTRSGKAIYENHNHPAHKNLSSSELQHLMFYFFDKAVRQAMEMKQHSLESKEYELLRTQMQNNESIHQHIAKLWRSSLMREKKLPK